MSAVSVTSPLEHRDIRGAAQPSKRDKDHGKKWVNGTRPSAGVRVDELNNVWGGSESQREKVRPVKGLNPMPMEFKSHANRTPKTSGYNSFDIRRCGNRLANKSDAIIDANDHTSSPLSRSLIDMLPTHANNSALAVQLAPRDASDGGDILYSFDNKGPSPSEKGRKVDLGGLVENAEKKWKNDMTEKIVKGEYEVLDADGETTTLSKGRKKSPKQRAIKNGPSMIKGSAGVEDDDGFELI